MLLLLRCHQNNQETQKGPVVLFIQNSWRVGKFNCISSRIEGQMETESLSAFHVGSPRLSPALRGKTELEPLTFAKDRGHP